MNNDNQSKIKSKIKSDNTYLKSPFNYVGGKYKLLGQIIPLFPQNKNGINTFVDMFCGGCNVALNVKAKHYVCNDIENHIIDFYNHLLIDSNSLLELDEFKSKIIKLIENEINEYCLSKTNKDGYLRLRDDYNKCNSWIKLYVLTCYSFCYQIRFNKSGGFNMTCGNGQFSDNMKNNLIKFIEQINANDYLFTSNDFRSIHIDKLCKDDFVYCDCPYSITTAAYNENGGWTTQDDLDLIKLLDKLNDNGIKFAMSNVLSHKGKVNYDIIEWINIHRNIYKVHHLNYSNGYKNSFCSTSDENRRSMPSDEVLICNY